MKVIMVKGISKTGKTTTAEALIGELRRRGYSVGSVKNIHYEAFTMETEGTDTDRHKSAGAHPVTARGLAETDIMFDRSLDSEVILDFYQQDYVVIEGDIGANCPVIITGKTEAELEEQYHDRVIAISGVISSKIAQYAGLPAIDATKDVSALVDLIEAKTPERMPNYAANCCSACGTDCRGLLAKILQGRASMSDCILKGKQIQLYIDGKEIPMVPFVKDIVRSVAIGSVKTLKGYKEDGEILIKIK